MQPCATLQILPRACKECWLLATIQPTVSFFIAQSLAANKYCTSFPATDKFDPMFKILQAVVDGFAKQDRFTSVAVDAAASKDLLTISPKQVLPFTMDVAASPKRHLLPAKLQGPLKTLVMLTQVMQLAVERFAHLEPETLEAEVQQVFNPTQQHSQAAKQRGRPIGVSLEEVAGDKAAGDEIPVAVTAGTSAAAVAAAAAAAEAAAEAAAALPADSHDSETGKVLHGNPMQTMADMHVVCKTGEQTP